MIDPVVLYGTSQPPAPSEEIVLGGLSFMVEGATVRHIRYRGVEMLRSVGFLVRDRDWGTLSPILTEVSRSTLDGFQLELRATFTSGATLPVTINLAADERSLTITARGAPDGVFETNRAGFTILHPADVAGCAAQIGHSGGVIETASFPDLIDPWQPFQDIVSLQHDRAGLRVLCELTGDTFEMEDQRQWGDASFKTYNRPLALPWPYVIEKDQVLEQSVKLTWTEVSERSDIPSVPKVDEATFPETALVLTAQDAERLSQTPSDITSVGPQRLLCHIDAALGETEAQIACFARLQAVLPDILYDAELICCFLPSVKDELVDMRAAMIETGFAPDSVLVCPSVDRQSTPPGSEWPDCPPLKDIHAIAAEVFTDLSRGGGMVSFFPELNRKRPPLEHLDFVSHGLCPIVHAADDISVIETLQAIPHITRTAKSFIGDVAYRIGPATIAMRKNPYGTRTIPNPKRERVAMADDDPRHSAQFGAAYVVGLATALAAADIAVWTPAAVYGPRGLEGPIVKAIAALAKCANEPVRTAEIRDGVATLKLGDRVFRANLTAQELEGLPPFGWE